MLNNKPTKKLTPEDLQHPKGDVTAWNGDKRKPRSERWNGSPDMEDKGFISRGGVHTVEGSAQPKPGTVRPAQSRPEGIKAIPYGHKFSSLFQRFVPDDDDDDDDKSTADAPPLTDRQKKQLLNRDRQR